MERLQELFRLYYGKTASAEQTADLMQLINMASAEQLADLIKESGENLTSSDDIISAEKEEEILQNILTLTPQAVLPTFDSLSRSTSGEGEASPKVRRMFSWWKYAAAAAILLLVTGYWLLFEKKPKDKPPQATLAKTDIDPGKYKARLTLANGHTIILDSAAMGELARQGNTSVISKDGQLVYESGVNSRESGVNSQESVVYNTVSTNNGENYSLTLADGSIVSLNSASSIKFPVAFPGAERRIEITGEAYFKVAKNAKQPFIVSVNGMEVQALGTQFNINAYADEATMNTTLIEGSVRVSAGGSQQSAVSSQQSIVIRPGQQTQLRENKLSVIGNVSIDEVIAWKQGYFHFESADLKTILRQFARWYNIEVIYQGPVSDEKFFSIMSRYTTLSNVLKSLQANDIKFRIEGKKLYVEK